MMPGKSLAFSETQFPFFLLQSDDNNTSVVAVHRGSMEELKKLCHLFL